MSQCPYATQCRQLLWLCVQKLQQAFGVSQKFAMIAKQAQLLWPCSWFGLSSAKLLGLDL